MTTPSPNPPRQNLTFDDFIGVLIAFTSIGAIFFWSIYHKNSSIKLLPISSLPSPAITLNLPAAPSPVAEAAAPIPPQAISPTDAAPLGVLPHGNPQSSVTAAPSPLASKPSTPTPKTPAVANAAAAKPQSQPKPGNVPPKAAPSPQFLDAPKPQRRTGRSHPHDTTTQQTPVAAVANGAASASGFSDIAANFWANESIIALTQKGIIQGFEDGTFRPTQPVTRGELAVMLDKAFDQPKRGKPVNFQDVAADSPAASAIMETYLMGFLSGYPNRRFKPDQPIPIVELQVALANGLRLKTELLPSDVIRQYKDAKDVPAYAEETLAAAIDAGIVTNYPDDNKLNPNQVATRADAAVLIDKAMAVQKK